MIVITALLEYSSRKKGDGLAALQQNFVTVVLELTSCSCFLIKGKAMSEFREDMGDVFTLQIMSAVRPIKRNTVQWKEGCGVCLPTCTSTVM